jgi:3',5'-cyclic AMP phosphodiesterase CpdA
MPEFRFVRAHDRHLSLWQSVVAASVHQQLGAQASTSDVLADPMMTATNDHVEAALVGEAAGLEPVPGDDQRTAAFLSRLGFEKGVALVDGDDERAAALDVEFRRYSNDDWRFLGCAATYADYYKKYGGVFRYNDWASVGKRDPNYAVIDWRLPNDAVLGVIGDWGTGLEDAEELLADLMRQHEPDAIIHLGDIYYSATPDTVVNGTVAPGECRTHYADVFSKVFAATGKHVPVFTLAGNHDYYALGQGTNGFYETFNTINARIPGAEQQASYFCLRSLDDGWQFLAMDTGYDDSSPLDQLDALYAGPKLQPTEVEWLQLQLRSFSGATVLLSHHQAFSAHGKINGMYSDYRDLVYMNPYLREAFVAHFGSDVAAWLWGHEHNFAVYRDGLFGLAKGRLVGCSAYEELVSAEPYKVNYPEVPYLDPSGYRVDSAAGYYNHGYAVIKLAGRAQPTDPVSIEYYQYPSWGGTPPSSLESKQVYRESLMRPIPSPVPITYETPLHLLGQEGFYIAPLAHNIQYYPVARGDSAAALMIVGGSGVIRHGDQVQIKTTEPLTDDYNMLGAWGTPALYYYTAGYPNQLWTVQKHDPTAPEVRYGDEVCFVNKSYPGQSLQPYWSLIYGARYLTTRSGDPYYWTVPALTNGGFGPNED